MKKLFSYEEDSSHSIQKNYFAKIPFILTAERISLFRLQKTTHFLSGFLCIDGKIYKPISSFFRPEQKA